MYPPHSIEAVAPPRCLTRSAFLLESVVLAFVGERAAEQNANHRGAEGARAVLRNDEIYFSSKILYKRRNNTTCHNAEAVTNETLEKFKF